MAKTDYNQGMDEETARGIAQLLRKPEGEYAIEVGEKMNEGNAFINHKTIEFISIQPGDHLLEVGMGNGFFVKDILGENKSIKYTGIDYSPEMVSQANDYNAKFIESGVVDFHLGNVNEMPFENETFNHVFSINTIYFWDDHKAALSEIKRVLKTNGVLTLSLRPKASMKDYAFVKYGFDMFSQEELVGLLEQNGFAIISALNEREPDQEIDGTNTKVETLIVSAKK